MFKKLFILATFKANNRVEHFKKIEYIYFVKFKLVRVYRPFVNVYLKTFLNFVI